jgi:hypothetical protein
MRDVLLGRMMCSSTQYWLHDELVRTAGCRVHRLSVGFMALIASPISIAPLDTLPLC